MFEILIISAVTAAVFALFILAFLIRKRPPQADTPVQIHRCADCNCDRSERDRLDSKRFRQQGRQITESAKSRR